jgi:DNA polymerase-3 subunit epsilon
VGLFSGGWRRRQNPAIGPLRGFLAVPAPNRRTPAAELPLLAVDFETTGLNPATDRLLSVGYLAVDGTEIDLSTAGAFVIRPDVAVGQSATIHGLTDDRVATGCPLSEAIGATLDALRGRVLLAHYSTIEESFLDRACVQLFGAGVTVPSVDTMMLQRHLLDQGNLWIATDSVRLWAAREHFGLPVYHAHEALTDALACAELYLAQISVLGAQTSLRRLQRWSG